MRPGAEAPRVSAEAARAFVAALFARSGAPAADAEKVAALIVRAELLGGEGHGLFRVPAYLKRLRAGGFNLTPTITLARDDGPTALVDGDDAIGHLVVDRMVREAMDRAVDHGVAWVGCRNSNHAGVAGAYALMPAERDLIGIYVAVGSANHMAPWGGVELLLSTNPIAIGAPGGESGPVLLDMATTEAAYGKVKLAAARGETMPEGWMIDAAGAPLTDPTKSAGGSLLPIGGPKGYGLALMIGLLAGVLNGAAFGRDVVDFNRDFASPTNTGQLAIVVDPARFIDLARFKAEIDRVRAEMKSSALRPGFDAIRLPGERALALQKERLVHGLPLRPDLQAALDAEADALGVPRILLL